MPKRTTVMPEHLQASFDGLRAHGLLTEVQSLDEALALPSTSCLVRAHAVAISRGHQPYGRSRRKAIAAKPNSIAPRLIHPPAQHDRKRLAAGDLDD